MSFIVLDVCVHRSSLEGANLRMTAQSVNDFDTVSIDDVESLYTT